MNTLIIGGTGPLGGYTALHLQAEGHNVTISSRNKPDASGVFSALNWVPGNYLEESFSKEDLAPYEAIVFAAGSDPRHVPPGDDPDEHFLHANGVMVPKFAKLAREAGVKNFVHIGSFYPHVLPDYIETNAYVRSRHLAAERVCELSTDTFCALSLDAPFVVGMPRGMKDPMWMAYLSYARGVFADVVPSAPPGGTNFISVRTLAQAVSGAIANGTAGKAYLLGDENLSFAEFFTYFFRALGNPTEVPAIDVEHKLLPDFAIMQGRGNFVNYDADPEDVAQLGYARNDVGPMIAEMAQGIEEMIGPIPRVTLGPDACFDAELSALSYKYFWAVDNGDKDVLRSVFTKDAVLAGPGFRHDGIEEILGLIDLLPHMFHSTRHESSQHLVEITGDKAVGEALCTASHILPPNEGSLPDKVLTWEIRYQDHYVKTDGKWRIARRGLLLDWIEIRDIHAVIQA